MPTITDNCQHCSLVIAWSSPNGWLTRDSGTRWCPARATSGAHSPTRSVFYLPTDVDAHSEAEALRLVQEIGRTMGVSLDVDRDEPDRRWSVYQVDATGNAIALRGRSASLARAILDAVSPGRLAVIGREGL